MIEDNYRQIYSWAKILEKIVANITPDIAQECADFCFAAIQFNLAMMQGGREKMLVPKFAKTLEYVKHVKSGGIQNIPSTEKDNFEQLFVWTEILDDIAENLEFDILNECESFCAAIIKAGIAKIQSDQERALARKFTEVIEKIQSYNPYIAYPAPVCKNRSTAAFDDPRHDQSEIIAQKLHYMRHCLGRIQHVYNRSDDAYEKSCRIYKAFMPKTITSIGKIRIGGQGDGGYVMPDLDYAKKKVKIAYSFGVSSSSPWDSQMANLGYDVFQYDGTIDAPPERHPNLHFYRYNISAEANPPENQRNIRHILTEHGHFGKNIILQCDIEGFEWEMFKTMNENEMEQFEMIIVEFHGLADLNRFDYHLNILEKINRTHQAVHVHCNNAGASLFLQGLRLLPSIWEVTYVRKTDYIFTDCHETFPSIYDMPNIPQYPDIFLGKFNNDIGTSVEHV